MFLHIFNPENDLALADGSTNYCPPPAALQIAHDLAALPLWFAGVDNCVVLPDAIHHEYYNDMSRQFRIASPFNCEKKGEVTSCRPWGWSPQIKRRLRDMGFGGVLPGDASIAAIREISNRKNTIQILAALNKRGFDTPPLPVYCTNSDEVADFVNSCSRCVVKAPWSGSGKGIMWGLGRVEIPLENFYKGVIKRQGGVVCECFLDSIQEFAMEFIAGDDGLTFACYSLFNSVKGSYSGNILAPDSEIECIISHYIPIKELHRIKSAISGILSEMLQGSGYNGYLGVDMMVYRDICGCVRLNPCMEVNMRMNMGVASRIIYDSYVSAGKRGNFCVNVYKKTGDALKEHCIKKQRYPLKTENGRVVSGYLNLSPIVRENRYSAYIIIDK